MVKLSAKNDHGDHEYRSLVSTRANIPLVYTMVSSLAIPQDIIDDVIAAVGRDKDSLKRCALVSSSFLLPCRKQLFSEISLRNDQSACRLHQFLVQNPAMQSFVRSITINDINEWVEGIGLRMCRSLLDTSLPALLRLQFRSLEIFSFNMTHPCQWNDFGSELKHAIASIIYIHSSTLKTLDLGKIIDTPINLFLGIVHLTKLELQQYSLPKHDYLLTPADLTTGVTANASPAVVDQCVWHLGRVRYHHVTERFDEPMFLPFMCRLLYFETSVGVPADGLYTDSNLAALSVLMRSLYMSLTSPATLEHLKLHIYFLDLDDFDMDSFYAELHDDDIWSILDSIVTRPIGSQLKRVDIKIDSYFREDVWGINVENHEENLLEAILNSLPLLHKKDILIIQQDTY